MRIDILHYAAPPVVGGVEIVIAHHARLMAEAGHQVRILAGRGDPFDDRIEFIRLPKADSRHPDIQQVKKQLDNGEIPASFYSLVSELADSLSELLSETQVLIAHNVCSLNKNLPLTAALRRLHDSQDSPRFILWHHDLAWSTPRYRDELHEGYPWDLLRQDWQQATQVVVSELRRRELAELTGIPPERIQVLPNGLDIPRFLKLESQTIQFIEQLNLLGAEPLLLLPVRITPRKNIELALHVVAALRSDFPRTKLVVTGPLGPHNPANVNYFNKLRALRAELKAENSVHFLAEHTTEYLPDSVIADFYRLADALLMPSREEGFGIPILEAGFSSLPVYCADIPPLRELAQSEANYFSPDGDPTIIAGQIATSLTHNPVFRLRARVRKSYSWEMIYQNYLAPLLGGETAQL